MSVKPEEAHPRKLRTGSVVDGGFPAIHPCFDGDEAALPCHIGAKFDDRRGDEIKCISIPMLHLLDTPSTEQGSGPPYSGAEVSRCSGDQAPCSMLELGYVKRWRMTCRSIDARADRASRRSPPREVQARTPTGSGSVA